LQSTVEDYSAPDFAKVANSYGIKAQNINADEITDETFKDFFSNNEPELLNIYLEQKTDLQPKLIFGQPIENMHPFLDKAEFIKTMLIEPLEEKPDE
jgi:acetolactate synthase-1/2/3 large subunit